ncbi:MAG: DUF4419 domain-containing protein [Fibrobacteria bacterium]|nr:DUF4419 domain-containing protein [Fibrobacteria bacterium]
MIRWKGGFRSFGRDSIAVAGTLVPAWTKDSTALRGAKALFDAGGHLIRLEIGPFDSLPVSGGTLRGVAWRRFDLKGTMDSLAVVLAHQIPWVGSNSFGHQPSVTAARPGGNPWIWSDSAGFRSVGHLSLRPSLHVVRDSGIARILSKRSSEITFEVDPVEPNLDPIPRVSDSAWRESRRLRWDSESRWVVGEHGPRLVECDGPHSFASTFVRAWNEHRPVRLSPDAVWMLLMEGLLETVGQSPDSIRPQMVRHSKGKKILKIRLANSFPRGMRKADAWRPLAAALLDSMDRFVVAGRHRTLIRPFSTTTPARAMASRLRVLQTYQSFFEYYAHVYCGIPSITLEGTVNDWKSIRSRLNTFAIPGLESWRANMSHILDAFVASAEGRPPLDFWKSFVRYTPVVPDCESTPLLNGWIVQFFDHSGRAWRDGAKVEFIHQDRGNFPLSIKFPDGRTVRFQVVSGFAGVAQATDGALYPELGWCVWASPPDQPSADKDKRDPHWDF